MALYLITGIGGFIGSSLARELLLRGEQVRGVDNFSTGRRENLAHIMAQVDFREADILDLEAMKLACAGVDYVLHQAAIPSVPKSVLDPIGSNRANIDGTVNVLVAARDNKVKRVVFAASSSAYGDTPTLPKSEDMQPVPISPYGVSKYVGELYAQTFGRCYGLENVCLRYFNIFGPRQDPDSPYSGVLSRFSAAFLDSTPPVVFGDGEQTRDLTYVDNAVQANILACEAPSASGRTFNVGTGHAVSLNQVLQMLQKTSGKTLETKYEPSREGDIRDSLADIRLAKEFLGYEPIVLFEEGLERTYAWYQANHAKNVAS